MTAAAPQYPTVTPAASDQVATLTDRRSTLEEEGRAIVVSDQPSLEAMVTHLKQVKLARAIVKEKLGAPVDTAHKLHKQLKAVFNEIDGPLADLERDGKLKITNHNREEEKRRRLAQLEEERIAREAEQKRRDEEAEALLTLGGDEDAQADNAAAAEEVLDASFLAPPQRETARPKAKGSSVKVTHKARVIKIEDVIKAAAEGNGNAMGILTDAKVVAEVEKRASQLAKVLKDTLDVPGIEVWEDRNVAIR